MCCHGDVIQVIRLLNVSQMRPSVFLCNKQSTSVLKSRLTRHTSNVHHHAYVTYSQTCLSQERRGPRYKATSGCSTSQSRVISIIIYSLEAAIKQSNECGCPPHHTITITTTTTTTLLALAWHAINPASPSHEPLAKKKGGGVKKTAATPRKHIQSN